MSEARKTYEGMFLVDAGLSNFEAASEPVRTVLSRSEANVLAIKPWDERRLAYEIDGHKRALYILTYFQLDPQKVVELERDSQLNSGILRCLILRKDRLSEDEIAAETPGMSGQREDEERREEQEDASRRPRRPREPAPAADEKSADKGAKKGPETEPDAQSADKGAAKSEDDDSNTDKD